MIKLNSEGNEVLRVQNALNSFGLDVGSPDGKFGIRTLRGVKKIQKTFNLSVDGVVGKDTFSLISKLEQVKDFKINEFMCRHCKQVKLDIELLLKLQQVRDKVGSIKITSGYRCYTHNKKVGGASKSQHLLGVASDLVPQNVSVKELYNVCNLIFRTGGVGRYKTFTHVDTRGYTSRW